MSDDQGTARRRGGAGTQPDTGSRRGAGSRHGTHFGATELPEDQQRVLRRARRLEIVSIVYMLTVIAAVVWNRDRQPVHDVLAGTAVVRS